MKSTGSRDGCACRTAADIHFRGMRFALILSSLAVASGYAIPAPPPSVQMKIDDNRILSLHFVSDPERRYLVEDSADLTSWNDHYFSPFKERGNGVEVRQVGDDAPPMEFYRVSVLPWKFQSLDSSGDWVGDASMALTPDGRGAFVFQNLDTNELYFGETPEAGGVPVVERIIGTGVEDEPDFWDNSGYSDVTLQIGPDGVPFVVCTENLTGAVVILWKPSGAVAWERAEIQPGLGSPSYWSFPKFAISKQGVMGVIYRGDDNGSYYAWASVTDLTHWNHVRFSSTSPSSATWSGIVFNDDGDAIVQSALKHFRIDGVSREAVPIWMYGQPQSRRGADGSLIALERRDRETLVYRSIDGGESWIEGGVSHQDQDGVCVSVDCDAQGCLSVFCPPSLYRQTTAGGPWERTVMRGREYTRHLANGSDKIQLLLVEYDQEVSLVTED